MIIPKLSLKYGHRYVPPWLNIIFELEKAEARAHILEGLKRALDMLDEVIALIRASKEPAVAKEGLMAQFQFSSEQSQAILDMRLQRLTGLEQAKILEEYENVLKDMVIFCLFVLFLRHLSSRFSPVRFVKIIIARLL